MNKLTRLLFAGLCLSSSVTVFADAPWLIRARAVGVIPEASSTTISLIGGSVSHISNQIVPELDFSYFFTPQLATELILATTRHSAEATNTALGSVDLGSVWLLPPTLTAQYHFNPEGNFNPYVGVGINYTYFYNVKNGPVSLATHYGNSFGPAFQIGADYALNDQWSINVDVKQVLMKSNVQVTTALGTLGTKVTINPLLVGVGVGYKFG